MASPRASQPQELKPENLRWNCDPNSLEFKSTKEIEPIEGILGQERALKAIRLGIDIRSPGYNIYIAGLSGTGKATSVKQILEKVSSECPPLFDYAYVNNFKNPDMPLLLKFPKGGAKIFKQNLASAIELLKRRITIALESDSYINRKQKIIDNYNEKEQELLSSLNEKLGRQNLSLGQIQVGESTQPEIIPIIEDQPVPVQQLDEKVKEGKISQDEAHEIVKKYNANQQELQTVFKKGLRLSQEFQTKLLTIERDAVVTVIKGVLGNLKENYTDKKTLDYLDNVEENILENIQIFKGAKPEGNTTEEGFLIDYFRPYEVNIILDNSDVNGCPVVLETSPIFINLFGTIEKISDGRGGWYSDFTNIKSGAMLRANGGFLILNVNHVFEEPGVWKILKRILTYRKLEIQDMPSFFQPSLSTLKPEPIEIDTKVILIGSQQIYSYLSHYEYDFKKIFKIKADFDYEINRSDHILSEYAQVIKKLIREEGLKEFDNTAISKLLEIAALFAGQKNKLTTRFSKIADMTREANFWASDDGFKIVSAAHVNKAYQAARERHGMLESKVNGMLDENMVLIDVKGKRIGQINGLAVFSADFYSFGSPVRITATVSLGSGSIINVEREAGMSGRHYNKGVLIITGYFKETFGQDLPLSFNANLVFEQSYGTVDGDSASCAEIYALLSTLAGLPIKQSIAVTGSLNQKGDVQPIGGVNEKIEGFFNLCKSRGFNKKQGVIIPIQNVNDLMLKEEIIDAVKKQQFHIYPISRVEEGIEILTDVEAGKRLTKGGYSPGTVFDLVEKKIKNLYEKSKSFKAAANPNLKKKKTI
jgi:lon-related putative ATP-dependent protease